MSASSSTAPASYLANTCTAALSDFDPEESSAGEEKIPATKAKSLKVKADPVDEEEEEEDDDEEGEPDECAHCPRS